jgi:hypothetical protein
MSKMNFLVFLQAYEDFNPSNNPSKSNFKWTKDVNGIQASNPTSQSFDLAPGETKILFNGTRTLLHDITTQYSISQKPLTSNTYILSAVAGTMPNFRTPRSIGIDATTEVTVTINGPLMTLASTGGASFNLTTVQIGDFVKIGSLFNQLNQGTFQILSKTSNSFTVENEAVMPEGPIVLGAGFAAQVQIYSAAGVQVSDTLIISGGFSVVSQNSYKVTDVSADSLEFYYTGILPVESNILTNSLYIYSSAKKLIYMESNKKVALTINGTLIAANIEPATICNVQQSGVFMMQSTIYSLSVTNNSIDSASVFLAAIE